MIGWLFSLPTFFAAHGCNVNHTERQISRYTHGAHMQSPHSGSSRCCTERHSLTRTTCPCVPPNLLRNTNMPQFPQWVTYLMSPFPQNLTGCYLSEHVIVFPRPSYRDTAEGLIIEVDMPLWRSPYDWFWPDEGWETLLSAHLTLMR